MTTKQRNNVQFHPERLFLQPKTLWALISRIPSSFFSVGQSGTRFLWPFSSRTSHFERIRFSHYLKIVSEFHNGASGDSRTVLVSSAVHRVQRVNSVSLLHSNLILLLNHSIARNGTLYHNDTLLATGKGTICSNEFRKKIERALKKASCKEKKC